MARARNPRVGGRVHNLGRLVQVRLRFLNPTAARRANETRWHPSQVVTESADGTVDLAFEVGGLLEITPWVLGWGDAVEVLAPAELQKRLTETARNLAATYAEDGAPAEPQA